MYYSKYKIMPRDMECGSCKKIIKNNYEVYMCVDNSFCSIHCRDKHFNHIKNIDPGLNYPEKWNPNSETKINCLIEIDYYKIPKKQTKFNRSQSLYNLSNTEREKLNEKQLQKEKMIITCIRLCKIDLKWLCSNRTKNIMIACFVSLFISILIKINK